MVIYAFITALMLFAHLLTGCTDAVSIDTPRQVDTLDKPRTVLRAVDVTERTVAVASVNGMPTDCYLSPASQCSLIEYSDSTIAIDANIILANRSTRPTLAVDIMKCTLQSGPVGQDSTVTVTHTPLNQSTAGLSITFFNTADESVDHTESIRVPTSVTRDDISEQRTLYNIDITRTYSGFNVTDDTTRIPFDVFSIRNTDLQIDTSYAITTRHVGTRLVVEESVLEPPLFGQEPIVPTLHVDREQTRATMRLNIVATGNQQLQALLGTAGTVLIEVTVELK